MKPVCHSNLTHEQYESASRDEPSSAETVVEGGRQGVGHLPNDTNKRSNLNLLTDGVGTLRAVAQTEFLTTLQHAHPMDVAYVHFDQTSKKREDLADEHTELDSHSGLAGVSPGEARIEHKRAHIRYDIARLSTREKMICKAHGINASDEKSLSSYLYSVLRDFRVCNTAGKVFSDPQYVAEWEKAIESLKGSPELQKEYASLTEWVAVENSVTEIAQHDLDHFVNFGSNPDDHKLSVDECNQIAGTNQYFFAQLRREIPLQVESSSAGNAIEYAEQLNRALNLLPARETLTVRLSSYEKLKDYIAGASKIPVGNFVTFYPRFASVSAFSEKDELLRLHNGLGATGEVECIYLVIGDSPKPLMDLNPARFHEEEGLIANVSVFNLLGKAEAYLCQDPGPSSDASSQWDIPQQERRLSETSDATACVPKLRIVWLLHETKGLDPTSVANIHTGKKARYTLSHEMAPRHVDA